MNEKATFNLPLDDSVRRILIIKWGALGDVVLATSAFEDIFKAFPNSEIHLNTLPQWKSLFDADPRFKKVITLPVKAPKRQGYVLINWLKEIGSNRYDVIFDLQENDRSRLFLALLWLTGRGAQYRVTGLKRFPYNVGSQAIHLPTHDFERMRHILQNVHVSTMTEIPILYLPPSSTERVRTIVENYHLTPLQYVILIVGGHPKWITKRWGKERYLSLAKLLYQQGIAKIVLIGNKTEQEECAFIETHAGAPVVNLCQKLELADIPILASNARGVISNDTGPAHLASVAKRPLIVICGPTDPRRVKPVGHRVKALQADLPCLNCYQATCSHHSCMREITPKRVFEEFLRLENNSA